MVSKRKPIYFPPLEDCLRGRKTLYSWKLVADALTDPSGKRQQSSGFSSFFADPFVNECLRNPALAFAAPDDATDKEFDTRTAAIHVTPTTPPAAASKFNLEQIREDARWLSKNARLNLVSALRITVVEYQARATHHLQTTLSSQELLSIQESIGSTNSSKLAASFGGGLMNEGNDAEAIYKRFQLDDSRRQRIYITYLAERRFYAMVMDFAHSNFAYGVFPLYANQLPSNPDGVYIPPEADDNGTTSTAAVNAYAEPRITAQLEVISSAMKRLQDGGFSAVTEDPLLTEDDAIRIAWNQTVAVETTHGLSIVFQYLQYIGTHSEQPVSVDVIRHWFSMLDAFHYLEIIHADYAPELVGPRLTLICAISLDFVNLAYTLALVDGGGAHDHHHHHHLDPDRLPYVHDEETLNCIHNSLLSALDLSIECMYPVIFAWTLLLQRLHQSYLERTDRRDALQQQRSLEALTNGDAAAAADDDGYAVSRRLSTGSIASLESTKYDGFLATAHLDRDTHAIEQMAAMIGDMGKIFVIIQSFARFASASCDGAFTPLLSSQLRIVFLQFLVDTYDFTGFSEGPVESALLLISGDQSYWDLGRPTGVPAEYDVLSFALHNEKLLELYLTGARNRYPIDPLPFLQLCQTLCTCAHADQVDAQHRDLILDLLTNMPTLTFSTTADLYQELVYHEDNPTGFRIQQAYPLVSTLHHHHHHAQARRHDQFVIPAGTEGRYVDDNMTVAHLPYRHSALELMGLRLHLNRDVHKSDHHRVALGPMSTTEVAETIHLLAILLRMESYKKPTTDGGKGKPSPSLERVRRICREVGASLDGQRDILNVVCDTMDWYMQDDNLASDPDALGAVTACLYFLHAVLGLYPGRVLSYLSRSGLLSADVGGSSGGSSKLSRIAGTIDLIPVQVQFLVSTIRLFSAVVDTITSGSVFRRRRQQQCGSKLGNRWEEMAEVEEEEGGGWFGSADKVLSQVSYAIAQACVDVYENSTTWKFPCASDATMLLHEVLGTLHDLVRYAYSMGDDSDTTPLSSPSLTHCLHSGAEYVLQSFLSPSSSQLRFQPLLSTLMETLDAPAWTFHHHHQKAMDDRLIRVLDLSSLLLRAAQYRGLDASSFAQQLFRCASLMARLSTLNPSYLGPSLRVIQALIAREGVAAAAAAADADSPASEPPSLLGYLGAPVARSFLTVLATLGAPFSTPEDTVCIWNFFTAVVRSKQQWLSNCLLSGKTPREDQHDPSRNDISSSPPRDSVLNLALSKLKSIQTLPPAEAVALLRFVTSAQNFWPWTVVSMWREGACFDSLRAYVSHLKPASVTVKEDALQAAYEARTAGFIAELFAMQLYHQRHMGTAAPLAKQLMADGLDYYLREGVQVAGYNKSLHSNFAKNFGQRYPGCPLAAFQRTRVDPAELGPEYYYHGEMASTMLSFDRSWEGAKKGGDKGFRSEMERANLNLSLVDAQLSLGRAWEYLLLELSSCCDLDKKTHQRLVLQKHLVQVAQQCLDVNQETLGQAAAIFEQTAEKRAKFALRLVQRAAKSDALAQHAHALLASLFRAVTDIEDPYASAHSLDLYRTSLRTLYTVLRSCAHSTEEAWREANEAAAVTQTALSILDRVVGKGFRTFVSLVHARRETTTAAADVVYPEDLALLTAVLQGCLSLPSMDRQQTQILNILATHDVVRVACSLFSWSDRVTCQGDPVYGEMSLLFLLELSKLPSIAEELACAGLLGQLTTANITSFMRRSSSTISPFASDVASQRCYCLWAKAMLPLLLNIVTAMGATVASEVSYVLNQFPGLLAASIERFEAPGASRTAAKNAAATPISLLSAMEVHSLALLTKIVAAVGASAPSLGGGARKAAVPVDWDAALLLEYVDFWLSSRRLLRDRILPLNAREAAWRADVGASASVGGGSSDTAAKKDDATDAASPEESRNELERRIVAELEGVREVLGDLQG